MPSYMGDQRSRGQRPSEEGSLAGHRQGGADPAGLQPAAHPLQDAVEGPAVLGQDYMRGPVREASQRGRGARRTLTPLMCRILAVAYLDLDGRLEAAQQPQRGPRGKRAEREEKRSGKCGSVV
ncbi:hypothetical protein NDU88_002706 [Pleurodeles waltl]|uniref:Uncharacterized protein n=1 Tax=Pleurodeles waltl TaxID=8319 RepID=A0AAV7NIG7_PLEWA|nr:hypothetical protein NDU88_002706 [Pleurodeles waltl]